MDTFLIVLGFCLLAFAFVWGLKELVEVHRTIAEAITNINRVISEEAERQARAREFEVIQEALQEDVRQRNEAEAVDALWQYR